MPSRKHDIAGIRNDYRLARLDENAVGDDPLLFFHKWFEEAEQAGITEVNAMTLATVDRNHLPHARIVLLKGLDEKGFVFFTNYNSAKGLNLSESKHAALVFFWKELERQVRIEGVTEKLTNEENNNYFQSRPEGSRIGAWASPQSQVIETRELLENNYKLYSEKFKSNIPCPPFWGGYRVLAGRIEFWQGRSNRMHDRILFERDQLLKWTKSRIAP